MYKSNHKGTELFLFEQMRAFKDIWHFVSSRRGGYSNGPFASLNIGFHVGDNNLAVIKNRQKLANALGIDLSGFTYANQMHSSNVALVGEAGRGKGSGEMDSAIENTDAMVTNVKRICLCVQVADCVPVLMYDPVERVIAAVHAGWRGILKRIVPAAVEKMIKHYGSQAQNIVAGIGPSNGPCCYEVEEDVKIETLISLGAINGIISHGKKPGKFIFDQWSAVKMQLKESGLKEPHIELAGICNQCNYQTFFSNRAGKGLTGRYAAGIML